MSTLFKVSLLWPSTILQPLHPFFASLHPPLTIFYNVKKPKLYATTKSISLYLCSIYFFLKLCNVYYEMFDNCLRTANSFHWRETKSSLEMFTKQWNIWNPNWGIKLPSTLKKDSINNISIYHFVVNLSEMTQKYLFMLISTSLLPSTRGGRSGTLMEQLSMHSQWALVFQIFT